MRVRERRVDASHVGEDLLLAGVKPIEPITEVVRSFADKAHIVR